MRKPYPTDLSDAEWNYIQPHLPAPKGHGRPRIHDLREILDAVFYALKSGCQWRLLPHDFPRWPTVYHYFRKWRIDGTWEWINRALRERLRVRLERDPQPSAGVVDSQSVKSTAVGGEDPRVERGSRGAPTKARPTRGADELGEGVGQRRRDGGLAGTVASQGLPGATSSVGSGADDRLDRPEQEDEQGLREAVCERRSVRVRCHESPHAEAVGSLMRLFHTVSRRALLGNSLAYTRIPIR